MSRPESRIAAYERHIAWEILDFAWSVGNRPLRLDELAGLEETIFVHPKAEAARADGADPYLLVLVATKRAEASRLGPDRGVLREDNHEQRLYDLLAGATLRRLGRSTHAWLRYVEQVATALETRYPSDAMEIEAVRKHVIEYKEMQASGSKRRSWTKGMATESYSSNAGNEGPKGGVAQRTISATGDLNGARWRLEATAHVLDDGQMNVVAVVSGEAPVRVRVVLTWLRDGMEVREMMRELLVGPSSWTVEAGELCDLEVWASPL